MGMIESGVVMPHLSCYVGSPWRENYHCITVLLGAIKRYKLKPGELGDTMKEADRLIGERNLETIENCDLGDVATYLECETGIDSVPWFDWEDYPNLKKLQDILLTCPEFAEIRSRFVEFAAARKQALGATPPP